MKVTTQELMDHLGVDHILSPYETAPWSTYDPDRGLTCNADVRMGPDMDDLEAEIVLVYDTPPEGAPSVEQIMFLHLKLDMNKKWTADVLKLQGETFTGKIYDWDKKACEFFISATLQLTRNVIPDFEEMIERIFKAADTFGSGTGGGGGRKPIIRPEQLLDPMKKF